MSAQGPFYNQAKSRLLGSLTSTAKGIDIEWLDSNISIEITSGRCIDCTLEVTADTAFVLEVTFDGGTNWTQLNSASSIPIDELFTLTILAKNGDLINFRSGTALTVDRLIVCATP